MPVSSCHWPAATTFGENEKPGRFVSIACANDSAGRALDYDVHEAFWNAMITSFDPFIDDGLTGNDVPFLQTFPFLAEPH